MTNPHLKGRLPPNAFGRNAVGRALARNQGTSVQAKYKIVPFSSSLVALSEKGGAI